jgi:hypothetical protein
MIGLVECQYPLTRRHPLAPMLLGFPMNGEGLRMARDSPNMN